MTKPADSDQIAKARQWLRELLEGVGVGHITYACFEDKQGKGWSVPELLAAFAESERQAVIEECCRAVCSLCSGLPHFGTKMSQAKYCESSKNWKHYSEPEGEDFYVRCAATAIRSME